MKTMHPKTTNVSTLHVTDLAPAGAEEISAALRELLADVFALYVKTKNFHWHMNGRHFRTSTSCSMTSPINSSP
jgi:starvation-inducible DNA-binding protein